MMASALPPVGDPAVIRFSCPHCQAVLKVPPEKAGAAAPCPRCAQGLRVPPPPLPTQSSVARASKKPEHLFGDLDSDAVPTSRPRPEPRLGGGNGLLVGLAVLSILAGLGGVGAYLINGVGPTPVPVPGPAPRPPAVKTPAAKKSDGAKTTPAGEALAAINAERTKAGLALLRLDDAKSRACQEHALYLAKNLPSRADLDPHLQNAALPGASEAGAAAAPRCSVAMRSPVEAVRAWLKSPGHLALLLDPALANVGVGFVQQAEGRWLSVFDFLPARPTGATVVQAVLYPGHLQTAVPVAFPGNEIPDPLPHTKEKLAGYPVTATFAPSLRLSGASARLEDEAGEEVPLWFSSPEQPANERHTRVQLSTLCLFARRPLRPGTRYVVRLEAQAGDRAWSRTWSFATVGAEKILPAMYQRAVARMNEIRKAAGLGPVRLDPERSAPCIAHAGYLARHLDRVEGLRAEDERDDLPGFTEAGRAVARRAAIRIGGGAGPADAVDWMMASVLNRHLILNPTMTAIGLGVAQQAPRGWIWVFSPPGWKPDPNVLATLYPGKGQKDVPIYFGRELGGLVAGQPPHHVAGFAVTANFFFGTKLQDVSAQLIDAGGEQVACWRSTPEKRLPGTGNYAQLLLIPKKPLEPATRYTVKMSAEVDGKSWAESWSFTTIDLARERAQVAALLRDRVNQARRQAGLGEVVFDDGLSRGCQAHARYVSRNLGHPNVQGLGIHDEDDRLPGATPDGARAGKAAVIAVISDPADSVESWLATLYHRLPLLDPRLKRIGYGQELHPFRGWITVLDAGNGR
jgi:uncharacterized protein YkwD